jgi:hypothetical protein
MSRFASSTAAWLACLLLAPAAFPQGYTPAPVHVAGSFESSCGAHVDADLRTGVSLLFLVEPEEAGRAFERAADASPDCAIASWGVVMASLALPDPEPAAAALGRASRALARARAATLASARERAYIDVATRLVQPPSVPYRARLRAFAAAARTLARTFPDDPHPSLLVALACLAMSTAPADMGQREAATAIALRFGDAPVDPGAAALLVLARDNAPDAVTARAAAHAVLRARPPSPRALQAAAHLFHRLGDWDTAVLAGEAALGSAGGAGGEWLLRDRRWREHPLLWLVLADAAAGRFARAHARLEAAARALEAAKAGLDDTQAWRLRTLLDLSRSWLVWAEVDWPAQPSWPDAGLARFESAWPLPPGEAGRVPDDDDRALLAEASAARSVVQGLVAARAAWPRGEPERLAAARAAAARLDVHAGEFPAPPRFGLFATQVRLATSAALEARDEVALLEAHTASLERLVAEASAFSLPGVAADQLAGDAHLQLRDWREAYWRFTALAGREPRHARAWLGAARAARRLGDPAAASKARAFLDIWKHADPDRPELVEALAIAEGLAPEPRR